MDNSTWRIKGCASFSQSRDIFTAWFAVYLLLLPVFLLVLYIGFSKWRRPRSASGGGLSHSDVFTLHMVVIEMASLVISCFLCYGYYTLDVAMVIVGKDMILPTVLGQTLFHSLTCVERYLAVIHPVAYMRLKGWGGVTVRNIFVVFVWVFSLVYALFLRLIDPSLFLAVIGFVLAFVPLPLVAYCSISVLRVLMRPKPGERGGNRKQIDQSKRSTINIMAAILGALLLRLITNIGFHSSYFLHLPTEDKCLIYFSCSWSVLPSSLVLPLLFLQRAGKLSCKSIVEARGVK